MASHTPEDLDGRWYHHYFVRGNTLIMIPGSIGQTAVPLGVCTWSLADLFQSLDQAQDEHLLDPATRATLERILQTFFDGQYIDVDYLLPALHEPSRAIQLRAFLMELVPGTRVDSCSASLLRTCVVIFSQIPAYSP